MQGHPSYSGRLQPSGMCRSGTQMCTQTPFRVPIDCHAEFTVVAMGGTIANRRNRCSRWQIDSSSLTMLASSLTMLAVASDSGGMYCTVYSITIHI
jgi:hypothetical protein